MGRPSRDVPLISIVIPVFNEQEVLKEFYARLIPVLKSLNIDSEIIFVDDGSTDSSPLLLSCFADEDECCNSIFLSRNFGKEIAVTAGLDYSNGDAVIVIDADLQDPPELIPRLVQEWHEGYDIVYAHRISRDGESWIKKATASAFYRVMGLISDVYIPRDTGDFRLLSRRVVDAVKSLPERHRFMKGVFSWVGFDSKAVDYERECRAAGTSKWNYWRLWNFALEGITSHTTMPLKISSYIGGIVSFLSFVYAVIVILKKLILGDEVAGYPSLMAVILFLGGVQLMSLGVIGEYLARTFDEVKQRPLYIVKEHRRGKQRA